MYPMVYASNPRVVQLLALGSASNKTIYIANIDAFRHFLPRKSPKEFSHDSGACSNELDLGESE